jgi:hypothetical protein
MAENKESWDLDVQLEAPSTNTAKVSLPSRFHDYLLDNRVLIAWALAAILWVWHGRTHEVDTIHQRHDLDTLMSDARVSVEQYLKAQGQLPEQLPDRILADFIKYTPINPDAQPPTYSLEGRLISVTEYWSNASGGVAK